MLRSGLLLAALAGCSIAAADSASIEGVKALLQEGSRLTADNVAALEAQLKDDPLDMSARTQLLGYYGKPLRLREPSSEARWRSLVLWLIHNDPKSEVLGTFPSPLQEFNRFLDPEKFIEGKQAFLAHLEKEPNDLTLLKHAIEFVTSRDRQLAVELLERAKSVDSSNPSWAIKLAFVHFNQYKGRLRGLGELDIESARKALVEFDRAFEIAEEPGGGGFLQLAAEVAVVANKIDRAREYADLMLETDPSDPHHYGDHVHHGNITLGKIALAQGDVQGAASFMLLAASTPGSQRLRGMGPDMTLAKELLEKGERESVLQYFDECARFWERGQDRLKEWTIVVQGGGIPNSRDFGW